MKASDIFPSKYIKSDDLQGRDVSVTISHVSVEKIGDDSKPILYFKGKEKGMVCNRTNFDRIAFLHGDETDDWAGKPVTLTTEFTQFQGKTMKALRIKPSSAPQGKRQVPLYEPAQSENPGEGMDDSIPF